jgi:hypothetical protein
MLVDTLIALAGGVLAAANLIIGMQPRAKELIDKLTPYQGAIGLGLLAWGAYNLTNLGLYIKLIGAMPVSAIAAIGMVLLLIIVGFILGFGLLSKYVLSRNEQAAAKGEQLRAKLAPLTGILGFARIGCALWLLLNSYVLKIAI